MSTIISAMTTIHNMMPSEGYVIAGLFGSIIAVAAIDFITSILPSKKVKA